MAYPGDSPRTGEGNCHEYEQKIRNKARAISGRAKQRFGRVTGNRRLKTEGKTDRILGNLKQSGEKVYDAFKC